MIGFSVNPAHSFEGKSVRNKVSSMCFGRVFFNLEITVSTDLVRFINSLNNHSDTALVMGILCVVSIQITNSLFSSVFFLNPILDKVLDLTYVHELNVIDMSVFLSLDDHIWRNALVTHSFRVWFMVFAFYIHFVSDLRGWKTVVALYIAWMHTFTFQFPFL